MTTLERGVAIFLADRAGAAVYVFDGRAELTVRNAPIRLVGAGDVVSAAALPVTALLTALSRTRLLIIPSAVVARLFATPPVDHVAEQPET